MISIVGVRVIESVPPDPLTPAPAIAIVYRGLKFQTYLPTDYTGIIISSV
jgi:hypothetical protein